MEEVSPKVQNHYHIGEKARKSMWKNKTSGQENSHLTGFLEIYSILRISLAIPAYIAPYANYGNHEILRCKY